MDKPYMTAKEIKCWLGCGINQARKIMTEIRNEYEFYSINDYTVPTHLLIKHLKLKETTKKSVQPTK